MIRKQLRNNFRLGFTFGKIIYLKVEFANKPALRNAKANQLITSKSDRSKMIGDSEFSLMFLKGIFKQLFAKVVILNMNDLPDEEVSRRQLIRAIESRAQELHLILLLSEITTARCGNLQEIAIDFAAWYVHLQDEIIGLLAEYVRLEPELGQVFDQRLFDIELSELLTATGIA